MNFNKFQNIIYENILENIDDLNGRYGKFCIYTSKYTDKENIYTSDGDICFVVHILNNSDFIYEVRQRIDELYDGKYFVYMHINVNKTYDNSRYNTSKIVDSIFNIYVSTRDNDVIKNLEGIRKFHLGALH
jgi:hypothetical protein